MQTGKNMLASAELVAGEIYKRLLFTPEKSRPNTVIIKQVNVEANNVLRLLFTVLALNRNFFPYKIFTSGAEARYQQYEIVFDF